MYREVRYEHSTPPSLSSKKADELALELYEEFLYRDNARKALTTQVWPACDDAVLCKRSLPKNKGMKWASRSSFGDTDIRDAVFTLSNAISVSLVSLDDKYIDLYSHQAEDQFRKNKMRDYQAYLHRKADLRGNYATHINQTLTRGVGCVGWEWRNKQRWQRQSVQQAVLQILGSFPPEVVAAMSEDQAKRLVKDVRNQTRAPETVFNGPVIYPLDMYDVLLDPTVRIGSDDDIPICIVQYRTLEELENTYDEFNQKAYGNLKDVTAKCFEEIKGENPYKYRNLRTLGVNPFGDHSRSKYVPVYLFHRQVQKQGNDLYVDTFFEVAMKAGGTPVLIRAYENPSDRGHPVVFFDTYSDTIANTPYQTGVVEKALEAWQSKNVISALTLQSQLVQVMPPIAVIADMIADEDGNGKVDVYPGGITHLKKGSDPNSFCSPLLKFSGSNEGMKAQQFYGTKISTSMGMWGGVLDSPDRQITRAKTATQTNIETTSSGIGRDNISQRFIIRSLEPLCQAILDASIQYNPNDIVQFERIIGTEILAGSLSQEDLQQEWKAVVLGSRAQLNKAQEMQEMQTAYNFVTTGKQIETDPQVGLLATELLFNILGRLGIRNLEQYRQDPVEQLLRHPVIQQQLQMMQAQAYQAGVQAAHSPHSPQIEGVMGGQPTIIPGEYRAA